MSEIAVGTKVFKRTRKLRNLLESVEVADIGKVYVADDGELTSEKEELYARDFDFELDVLDLPYDAGLGFGRRRIVERLEEPYFLLVDSDHEIPPNVWILREMLADTPAVGGIAGNIIEPEKGRLFQDAKDIGEDGDVLIRDVEVDEKRVETLAGYPFVPFDFIPNAAMFRRECLEDYAWDENYVIGHEHIDFYVGHWKQTDWRFGICPSVCFPHYPGGSQSYMTDRHDEDKIARDREYFLEKWGYSDFRSETMYWFDTHEEPAPLLTRARSVYERYGALTLLKRTMRRGKRSFDRNLRELLRS